ncbi:uncharacterized protein LOC129315064 isoform X2 [Prosopis cineraria]|uniref:uncharacterized protein LOC129315064 isoform X2 n=1 Tax=Prosopis cineraria TaxID=364024 RepID=UPI00240EC00B|nr:uncharacterized protein LOC129315064 isoform X2 [Prosopis cineraria]
MNHCRCLSPLQAILLGCFFIRNVLWVGGRILLEILHDTCLQRIKKKDMVERVVAELLVIGSLAYAVAPLASSASRLLFAYGDRRPCSPLFSVSVVDGT